MINLVCHNIIKDFIKENDNNLEFLAYDIKYVKNINVPPTKTPNLLDTHYESYKNLENLIRETQPFVKMVKYDDLVVRVSDIDGNLVLN